MTKGKRPYIGGKAITRKKALRGLGNPKNWARERREVVREFRERRLAPKEIPRDKGEPLETL